MSYLPEIDITAIIPNFSCSLTTQTLLSPSSFGKEKRKEDCGRTEEYRKEVSSAQVQVTKAGMSLWDQNHRSC